MERWTLSTTETQRHRALNLWKFVWTTPDIKDWVQGGAASGDRKGENRETNPMDLTCFLSITCRTIRRNKPKRDMFHGIRNLERKRARFWRNLYDIGSAIH